MYSFMWPFIWCDLFCFECLLKKAPSVWLTFFNRSEASILWCYFLVFFRSLLWACVLCKDVNYC